MMELPDDYTVRLVDMPVAEGGMISESPDGHVNVYINARWSTSGQFRAAEHEYEHWINDDLNNDDGIQTVENRAHHRRDKMSRLATLKRASELPRPAKYRPKYHAYDDWKDDVLHKMEYRQ